uniref:Uncharacterized protein n=1 Tax=Nicotiana tabacum TaxID=4097 RepID=A0A1S4BKC6_TOBAC|nr:uncharacterized protein LOC104120199 [Nicotiana tomentosiformis]XP_016489324.1 PREDICTED: uncharacterized protein LOC107809239 [Nicotiana tabacum]
MAANQENMTRAICDVSSNLMNAINESYEILGEDVTPTASPRRERSPPPYCSTTKPNEKRSFHVYRRRDDTCHEEAPRSMANQYPKVVYALEKLGTKVKWPPKMRSDSSTRISNALYKFPPGTQTQNRRLYRPKTGGSKHVAARATQRDAEWQRKKDDSSINGVKFISTHKLKNSITYERNDGLEESTIFDESDANNLTFPHNDALVITVRILDNDVKRIMVDDGSGACIIHPRVLAQMRLEDKIVPRCITLTSFNNAVEQTLGRIALPFLAGGITLEITFHIIDQATTYNAIVG